MAGMKFGMMNLTGSDIGKGPGNDTGAPKWNAGVFLPSRATVVADIAAARTNGMVMFTNFAGARNSWTDAVGSFRIYNAAKYETNVRYWTVAGGSTAAVADAIALALTDKVMIAYTMDEPYHSVFNGSIKTADMNQAGLLHKSIWPGCVTVQRSPGSKMQSPPSGTGDQAGGWTGLDYGWAQYEGATGASDGVAPATYFADQKALLSLVNLGMIAGFNIWNGASILTLDGISPCWDYLNNGVSSGMVRGTTTGTTTDTTPKGSIIQCGQRPSSERRFVASPDWLKHVADVIASDADVPAFVGWTHSYTAWTDYATFNPYYIRADFVSALDYMANLCAARGSDTGWRTIKGIGVVAPPATVGVQHIASATAAATTIAIPTHGIGDLIVISASRTGDTTTPSLASGWTNIASGNANLISTRVGYFIATTTTTVSGTWANAHNLVVSVYRGAHPTAPFGDNTGRSDAGSSSIEYQDITFTVTDGTSWVHMMAVHGNATDLNLPPAGAVNRSSGGRLTVHDSNGGLSLWNDVSRTYNASGAYRTHSFELKADPAGAAPPTNGAPVLTAITAKSVVALSALAFSASATDPDGHTVNYTLLPGANPVPAGATVNLTTGAFAWTPTRAQAGTHNVIIRATDVVGSNPAFPFDEETFTITVTLPASDTGEEEPPPENPATQTGRDVASRAQDDLDAAQALLNSLELQEQINAAVITQVQALIVRLEATLDYCAGVIVAQTV